MRTRSRGRSGSVFCVLATVATLLCAAGAAESADAPVDRFSALQERVAAGDLRYVDGRTGEVVVATEERVAQIRHELEPHFDWPSGAEIDIADDGTVRADIGGAMRDVMLVRTNLDGTRERGCFRDLDAAVAFVVGLDFDERKRLHRHEAVAASE